MCELKLRINRRNEGAKFSHKSNNACTNLNATVRVHLHERSASTQNNFPTDRNRILLCNMHGVTLLQKKFSGQFLSGVGCIKLLTIRFVVKW
jgi:hypothetical protein